MDGQKRNPWGKKGRQCRANSKQSGERCRRAATPGALVCRFHGSRAPQVAAKAAEALAEAEVREVVTQLGITPVENPLLALQHVAGEVMAWKDAVRQRMETLERWRYSGDAGTEQIRGEIMLWERALDRAANVLGLIAKLNIDDRLARIEEAKITLVVESIGKVLADVGLPVDKQLKAKAEMARLLRRAG